jgi:hypothetical protein
MPSTAIHIQKGIKQISKITPMIARKQPTNLRKKQFPKNKQSPPQSEPILIYHITGSDEMLLLL